VLFEELDTHDLADARIEVLKFPDDEVSGTQPRNRFAVCCHGDGHLDRKQVEVRDGSGPEGTDFDVEFCHESTPSSQANSANMT
jgi:hypothetical protein